MPLVTTTEMFKKAYDNGYAIGAFNVNNMEIVQGITSACKKLNAPVILQVSSGARKSCASRLSGEDGRGSGGRNRPSDRFASGSRPDFETCKSCIDGGFTSVMIDGSSKPYEENVELTRKVVEYAHAHGVVVEGELGKLAGIEDDVNVSADDANFTQPEEVEDFVSRTGVDSLAIAIGTSHGAYKFKPGQKPQLRFDILLKWRKSCPASQSFCTVASSVMPEYVKMINEFGGEMPDAIGIPEEMLRKAASMAVCKINVDSDIRLAMTASIRKHFAEYPSHFDPRQYPY